MVLHGGSDLWFESPWAPAPIKKTSLCGKNCENQTNLRGVIGLQWPYRHSLTVYVLFLGRIEAIYPGFTPRKLEK
jgi:hypothetical protein